MESDTLGPRISLCIGRTITAFLGCGTLIPFTLHCAMSFFSQLDRWDGIPEFSIMRWRIKEPLIKGSMCPWKNIFTIASTFTPLILSPTISSLLASFFRPMFVSLGQLLSSSTLHNLVPFRTILEWSFIKAWQMLLLPMWMLTSMTWAKGPFFLHLSLVAHTTCSNFAKMPWPSIGILEVETFSSL